MVFQANFWKEGSWISLRLNLPNLCKEGTRNSGLTISGCFLSYISQSTEGFVVYKMSVTLLFLCCQLGPGRIIFFTFWVLLTSTICLVLFWCGFFVWVFVPLKNWVVGKVEGFWLGWADASVGTYKIQRFLAEVSCFCPVPVPYATYQIWVQEGFFLLVPIGTDYIFFFFI